jgi:hypothetical protein
MRMTRKAGLILISSFALAGAAVAGVAAEKVHYLTIALPDGSVEHIHYIGDIAPRVVVLPATAAVAPMALIDAFDAPFAELDRMTAEMDRQSDAMLRQAALLAAQPANGKAALAPAVVAQLPAGSVSYSFVSTSNGNRSCSQSWQVTSYGPNQKPKVVSQSSGNCATAPTKTVPATQAQPDPALPKLVPAKLDKPAAPSEAKPANRT